MIVTLDTFEIANGRDRLSKMLGQEQAAMTQDTPTDVRLRAEWVVGFPGRAVRQIQLSYPVTWPSCDTQEAAHLQSRVAMALCPKGGPLTEQLGSTLISYEQAWINSVTPQRIGVTNLLVFALTAINPSTAELSPLAQMSADYLANLSRLTDLTGGDETTDLDAQITVDVSLGFAALMWVSINGLVQQLTMRLIEDPEPGETNTNTDPETGPLIVLPLDYDDTTNAKIWVQ